MLAYGVVFVLLIGEIDLSIGFVGGVAGVVVAELQLPDGPYQIPGCSRSSRCSSPAGDRRIPGLDRRADRRARRSSSRWPASRSGRA